MGNLDTDHQLDRKRGRSAGSWIMLAILAAVVCLYVALLVGRHTLGLFPDRQAYREHPAVGQRLPYLKLQPLTGDSQPVTLEDLKGQTVLLNFWGTWCPPCREEFPHLATLAEKLKNESDFRLLAVSCGGGSDEKAEIDQLKADTLAYLQHEHSRLSTYADRSAATRMSLAMLLQDEGFVYPTTILLDGNAQIRGVWLGYNDGATEQMERAADELLHPAAK
jgi:thiol-disulfide isomerase/thioredoxin